MNFIMDVLSAERYHCCGSFLSFLLDSVSLIACLKGILVLFLNLQHMLLYNVISIFDDDYQHHCFFASLFLFLISSDVSWLHALRSIEPEIMHGFMSSNAPAGFMSNCQK